jgi:hypothetical protein
MIDHVMRYAVPWRGRVPSYIDSRDRDNMHDDDNTSASRLTRTDEEWVWKVIDRCTPPPCTLHDHNNTSHVCVQRHHGRDVRHRTRLYALCFLESMTEQKWLKR